MTRRLRIAPHLAMLLAALALLAPVADAGGATQPTATASKNCGTIKTRNGGTAKYVNAVNVKCRTAKRVARRAKGKKFSYRGFSCKPRKSKGLGGKLFGCGRAKNGKGQGVGFIYVKP